MISEILENRFNQLTLIVLGLLVFIFIRLIGFNGLYGQDSYEYTRYCGRWILCFLDGTPPGDYFWPLNYPISGAFLGYGFGLKASTALQLLSILSFIGNGLLINSILKALIPTSDRKRLLWIVIAYIFAPYSFRSGLVNMSDTYASFMCLLTFYFALKVVRGKKPWFIPCVVFFTTMAIMTRYICVIVLLPIGIYLLASIWKRNLILPTLVAVPIGVVPIIPHIMIRMGDVAKFASHPALLKWSVANVFSRTFESDLGQFEFAVPNILYLSYPFIHAGFIFFGLGLLFFFRKPMQHFISNLKNRNSTTSPAKEFAVIGSSVLIFLLFIGGMDTQNSRYFITIFPLVIILLFPFYIQLLYLLDGWSKKITGIVVTLLLICQLGLAGYAFKKYYTFNKHDKELVNIFIDIEGKTVYTYGTEMMLSHYNKKNTYLTLHKMEGLAPDSGTMFLFNHDWKDHPQVRNSFQVNFFKTLLKEKRLKTVKTLNSWELFEIN